MADIDVKGQNWLSESKNSHECLLLLDEIIHRAEMLIEHKVLEKLLTQEKTELCQNPLRKVMTRRETAPNRMLY